MATPDQLAALTSEKSLWDVYKVSRRIPSKKGYTRAQLVAAVFIAVSALVSHEPVAQLADHVRDWSALGFNFALAILGFLLAGYAVFATLSGVDVVKMLAETNEPDSGLPYLKYTTVQFMRVFIHYLAFVALHLVITLLGWRGGLLTVAVRVLCRGTELDLWRPLTVAAMALVGTCLVNLWITLQAFVFNVYSSVMAMARLRLSQENQK